ncbi:hypothetical protein [Methanobrevibacter sp.]|uniref:hypothetical protein n=1 Tax=Methanobrevibacter sp. TaxID=66852 RepID=UPI0038678245
MVQFPQEFIDECFIEEYEKLNAYLEIPNMVELRDLMISFKHNEKFVFVSGLDYSGNIDAIEYNPKLKNDIEGTVGVLSFLFNNSEISLRSIETVFNVIELSCIGELHRELSSLEKEKIFTSDLFYKLTFAQENFLHTDEYNEVNKLFFKKLCKIKWADNSKMIKKNLYDGLWFVIGLEHDTPSKICTGFGICVEYLSCCRALTHGRSEVSTEDVVQSWLLTLNLFLMDLRPYIKDFNSASNLVANTDSDYSNTGDLSEEDSSKKSSSLIRKILTGILSIIIVVILLLGFSIIFALIFGDNALNYAHSLRPFGVIGLALAAAFGKKIYDKLV